MADTRTQQQSGSREQGLSRQGRGQELQRWNQPATFGDPFDLFTRMSDEMDRTFDRLMRDFGIPRRRSWLSGGSSERGGTGQQMWAPRIEAVQKGDQFLVRAELPGMKREDIQVELTEDALTIRGERREEREERQEGYFHSEREYGEFSRTIPLPQGTIGESAEATFKDGLLEIKLQAPPAEANRGRRVEIQDAPGGGEPKK